MDGTLLAATESAVVSVDAPEVTHDRGLSGVCLLFGPVGNSSAGKTRFMPGSLRLPADMSRVKLLLDHDATDPLGYLTGAEITDEKFVGAFTVADGPRGDLALAQATDKRRDGLSVGCQIDDWRIEGDVVVIKAATLTEVSLVSIPAFTDARITQVRAAREAETIVDRKLLVTCSNPDAGDEQETTPTDTPTPAPAPEVDAPKTVTAAAAPFRTAPRGGLDVRGLVARTKAHLTAGLPAAGLTAALADIVPAGHPNLGPNKPTYVGELWEASTFPRPLIEAIGTSPLTSLKMQGFRWVNKPEVDRYSGNKTEIPTGPITREPAEKAAQRFAGGWDVDRVFIDLPGGEDFLSEVFAMATDDYRLKSEAYVAEQILAEATSVPTESTTTVPQVLSTLGRRFGALGANLNFVQMSTDYWTQFVDMGTDQAPWWLQKLGTIDLGTTGGNVGGLSFRVNPSLPTATVVAGDRRAVKIAEVDPPIRVQAIDLPRGGVDLGVFGYIAAMVTDPRAVVVLEDTTP